MNFPFSIKGRRIKQLCAMFSLLGCLAIGQPAIQWSSYKAGSPEPPKVTEKLDPVHGKVIHVEVVGESKYQGAVVTFDPPVDLKEYEAIEFEVRHNLTKKSMALAMRIEQKSGVIQSYANTPSDAWNKVVLPLKTETFMGEGKQNGAIGTATEIRVYPYSAFSTPGMFMEFANFRLVTRADASVSRKLPVASCKHTVAPTSGDDLSSALCDGDTTKNVHYRAYSNDPDFTMDLGGSYAIDELKVDAVAAPSHNFTTITVQCSLDGKNWYAGGLLKNSEVGTEPRAYSCTLRPEGKPMVGRYFRMKAVRLRTDHMVNISEVTFTGHSPSESELKNAAEQNYDTGNAMPERNAVNYAELKDDTWQLFVSRTNGVVNGVFYKGKLLVEKFVPQYVLQSKKEDIPASGYEDKVINLHTTPSSVTVTVTNPKLPGLAIVRTWKIEKNNLWEKVTVVNHSQTERFFLQLFTGTIFEQGFRKNSFYEMPGSAIYSGMYRIPASEVMMDRAYTNTPCLGLENGKDGLFVWHSRHRFNDDFTYMDVCSEESNLQTFRPNGWLMHNATIVPADATIQSFENRFAVTEGSMLKAFDEYLQLPEVASFRGSIRRPKLVRDVRFTTEMGWDGAWPKARRRLIRNFMKLHSHRGYMVNEELLDMDGIWGDLPTSGPIRGSFGEIRDATEVRKEVRDFKKADPRFKVSIYTWFWSAFPWSTPVKNHPEWFVTKLRNGAAASWFPMVNTNYLRFWGIHDSRHEATKQIADFVNYYEQDLWYMDGGKPGVYAKDWDTMRIDHPLGKTWFYKETRDAIRKNHPDRFVMFNHAENPLGDLGYLESSGDTLTSEWRRGATMMWKFKMFAYKDPLKQSIYTYWRQSIDGIFHNYLCGINTQSCYNSRRLNARDLPYQGARFDIRMADIRDAMLSPDWRLDFTENLECMALNQQNNSWIFMQYHGDKPETRQVSADAAALGITDKSRPVHYWHYTIRDARQYNGTFSEPQIAKGYSETGWISERAVTFDYLGAKAWSERISGTFEQHPQEAQLLMVTQVPAAVLSIENDPMHYYLAGQPGITVDGNENALSINSEYKQAEIGVILKDGQVPANVMINGKPADFRIWTDRNLRMAVFKVGTGDTSVTLAYRNAVTVQTTDLEASIEKGRLTVKVKPDNAPVQIYGDNALALTRDGSFELNLPDCVRDGEYLVVSGSKSQKLTLKGIGRRPVLEPILITAQDSHSEKKVGKKIRGMDILQQATCIAMECSHASVEPEKLTLEAGTLPLYENHFNNASAALQLKCGRFVKLRIVNGAVIHTRYAYYPTRHCVRPADPESFFGLIFDFEKKDGSYSRSAAGIGHQTEKRRAKDSRPRHWGAMTAPAHVYQLIQMLYDPKMEEETAWLDLASIGAPMDWNGTLWITLHVEHASPDRHFKLEILESADTLPADARLFEPVELGIKKQSVLHSIKPVPKNGDISSLPPLPSMVAAEQSSALLKTILRAAYDDTNLYFFFECHEKKGHILNYAGGTTGNPWESDSVEFYIQRTDNPAMMLHGIVDAGRHIWAEEGPFRPLGNKKGDNLLAEPPYQAEVKIGKENWSVKITLPWKSIGGKPKGKLGFNLMRNSNEQGRFNYNTLSNNGVYFSQDQCQLKLD